MFFPWGIFYDINVGLFKISILLLYRRVFAVRWLRITVDVNVAFITAFTIALVGKDVFACTPIRRQWTPDLPGSCIDLQATYYWASALFLLTDLIILILPQPLVWRLQISRRQKFGLTLIFCLGIMLVPTTPVIRQFFLGGGLVLADGRPTICSVTVATILRLVVVIRYNRLDFACMWPPWPKSPSQAFPRELPPMVDRKPTDAFVPVVYWMGAESSLGIICACCATIRPLFQAKKSGVAHYSGYLRHTGSSVDRQSRAPATFTSSTTRQNSAQLGTSAKARSDDATLLDPDPEIAIPLGRIMIKKDIDVEGSRSEGSL